MTQFVYICYGFDEKNVNYCPFGGGKGGYGSVIGAYVGSLVTY